jgi:hypothetical protein
MFQTELLTALIAAVPLLLIVVLMLFLHWPVRPEVLQAMQRWADDELRSLNAQIEYVLRDALRKSGRLTDKKTTKKETRP